MPHSHSKFVTTAAFCIAMAGLTSAKLFAQSPITAPSFSLQSPAAQDAKVDSPAAQLDSPAAQLDSPAAQLDSPTVHSVAKLLQSDQLDEAVEQVQSFDDRAIQDTLSDVDTTLLLAQVARACENAKDDKTASDLYARAVAAVKRSADTKLTAQQVAMIQLAAGSSSVRAGKSDLAVEMLAGALAAPHDETSGSKETSGMTLGAFSLTAPKAKKADSALSPAQQNSAIQLLTLLGSEALSNNQSKLAEKAYATALPHVTGKASATVMLGHAWAMSMQENRGKDAAKALEAFVRKHPNHSDVASAAELCVAKYKSTGDTAAADVMTSRLLTRWSKSQAAKNVVAQYTTAQSGEVPESVKTWLLGQTLPDRIGKLDASTCASAFLVAIEQQQVYVADGLVAQLAKVDQKGQSVSDVLQRLTKQGNDSDAEQLATRLLAPTAEHEITPAAREAACRWAGRQQRWSMLALASESSDVNVQEPSRTIAVERLFAEALTQVGRGQEAQVWWNHLVDSREVTDFATLLRCAETATTYADVPTATNRISDAKSAAGLAADRVSLVQMLSAELAVRELKFDDARSILHDVIRSDGAITSLRGRAQWMIGETHYLQEKFADAIEAYRKVEGIDPDGSWVAIALVQAGKSFEQLGRTREAAVCYSTLVSRFAESPHAVSARRRLAAIDPTSTPSSTTETIRR